MPPSQQLSTTSFSRCATATSAAEPAAHPWPDAHHRALPGFAPPLPIHAGSPAMNNPERDAGFLYSTPESGGEIPGHIWRETPPSELECLLCVDAKAVDAGTPR